jgi:hypothetical protein
MDNKFNVSPPVAKLPSVDPPDKYFHYEAFDGTDITITSPFCGNCGKRVYIPQGLSIVKRDDGYVFVHINCQTAS